MEKNNEELFCFWLLVSDCIEKFFCLRDICKFERNCTKRAIHSKVLTQGELCIIDEYKALLQTTTHVFGGLYMYWKKYWGSFVPPPICFHVSVYQSLSNVCTCLLRVRPWIKVNKILCRFQGLSLTSDMKPAHHTLFRDQVSTLVEWFANWNECEQTIALYTLLKRISTIQAKFLSLILEHTFRDDSFEVQMMQRRANDKGSIYFEWCTWAGYSGQLLFITVGICVTARLTV